jgi:hypothetical protein
MSDAVREEIARDLLVRLSLWTRQISEQPAHRVAAGIASAAARLHTELHRALAAQESEQRDCSSSEMPSSKGASRQTKGRARSQAEVVGSTPTSPDQSQESGAQVASNGELRQSDKELEAKAARSSTGAQPASPTPRTDAAQDYDGATGAHVQVVPAEVSRFLELRLEAALGLLRRYKYGPLLGLGAEVDAILAAQEKPRTVRGPERRVVNSGGWQRTGKDRRAKP